MLSLACLMALLAYSSSQSALYRSRTDDNTWSSNYEQYGDAINSDLVDTAYRKRVSLGAGSQCSAGYHPILPAGTLSEGDITTSSASTGTTLIGVCNNTCPNEFSREIPTITPVNSRQLLETSQNVVQTSLNQFSYVLTIRTNGWVWWMIWSSLYNCMRWTFSQLYPIIKLFVCCDWLWPSKPWMIQCFRWWRL